MKLSKEFLERVARAAVDEGIAQAVYSSVDTPIGRLLVVASANGVCRIGFEEEPEDRVLAEVAKVIGPGIVASASATKDVRDELAAYLEGERTDFDFDVDLSLTRSAFGRSVLDAAQRIPRGQVTTYSKLAASIEHPGAARATGTALGRNPVPIVVPCHRVVPGSGGVGGYGGGPERKRLLLRLEGATDDIRRPHTSADLDSSDFQENRKRRREGVVGS